jgi:hypothetical protein
MWGVGVGRLWSSTPAGPPFSNGGYECGEEGRKKDLTRRHEHTKTLRIEDCRLPDSREDIALKVAHTPDPWRTLKGCNMIAQGEALGIQKSHKKSAP